MNVLGLKMEGHDPGAALISTTGGKTRVMAIAEERLSRIKHASGAFPTLSIAYVLEGLGVKPSQIDLVAYDASVDNERFSTQAELEVWLRKSMGAGFESARLVSVGHHDAHAATAFFCSPYDEAAVLVYDGYGTILPSIFGVPSAETETIYRGQGNTLTVVHKTEHALLGGGFPFSVGIGRLYANLSQNYISFGPHNEGKMMGLAAYGDDSFLKKFPYERWVQQYQGSILCNNLVTWPTRSAGAFVKRSGSVSRLLVDINNGVRARGKRLYHRTLEKVSERVSRAAQYPSIFTPIRLERPVRDGKNEKLPDTYFSSVAYAAQKIFEQFAIDIGRYMKAVIASDTICIAGGCALNIDANRNFLDKVGYKNIFVQPASSDCGIALGCALWGLHVVLGEPRSWVMNSAALGRQYREAEILDAVKNRESEIEWQKVADAPKETAKLIADGAIIGWFQGGSEYGPRALGNRSILCDARNPSMKDTLNNRVKHRESWRPFAASVLLETTGEWFGLEHPSPFMLLTGTIPQDKRSKIPSIVHVDNTCRIQSLTEADNGPYWRLVKEFHTLTGTPLVLNTSFNLGGDPIVESPADALDTFLRTDMDYLVLENVIIRKRPQVA
jgi:carbamoyltransferase